MTPLGSLPCAEESATGLYPEPHESSFHHYTVFLFIKQTIKVTLSLPALLETFLLNQAASLWLRVEVDEKIKYFFLSCFLHLLVFMRDSMVFLARTVHEVIVHVKFVQTVINYVCLI